jgi:hypothetical protein
VVRTRGPTRSSTSRNYTRSELRFRALLTENDAKLHYHSEGFDRFGKALV